MVENSSANEGDVGLILGSGPQGNGNPLQYSYLRNSMDRGFWLSTVHGVTKGWTNLMTKQLCFYRQSLDLFHLGMLTY